MPSRTSSRSKTSKKTESYRYREKPKKKDKRTSKRHGGERRDPLEFDKMYNRPSERGKRGSRKSVEIIDRPGVKSKNVTGSIYGTYYQGPAPDPKKLPTLNPLGASEGKIVGALLSMTRFPRLFFRMPVVYEKKSKFKGGNRFNYKRGITGFNTTSVFIFLFFGLILFNLFAGFIFDYPSQPKNLYRWTFKKRRKRNNFTVQGESRYNRTRDELRAEEVFILARYAIILVIILLIFVHLIVSSYCFHKRRRFIEFFFNHWVETCEKVKLDFTKGIKKFIKSTAIPYCIYLLILILFAFIKMMPVATGAPAMLFLVMWRVAYQPLHTVEYFWVYRTITGCFLIYIIAIDKLFIIFYMYTCKFLSTAFQMFNKRLDFSINGGGELLTRSQGRGTRVGLFQMFKDHAALLDLLEGVDIMFTGIIESFYATHVISLVLEMYIFSLTLDPRSEIRGVRRLDGIVYGLYLMQSLFLLYFVSASAAEVGDSAMEGLEIIRRRGVMGHLTDNKLFFIVSMYMSYTGYFESVLYSGKYFLLDKGFFIGTAAAIICYLIITTQFAPPMELISERLLGTLQENEEGNESRIEDLLSYVEGTIDYFRLGFDNVPILNQTNFGEYE